jgi:hypothetical protein
MAPGPTLVTARSACSIVGAVTAYLFVSDVPEHLELVDGFARFSDVRPSRPSLSPRQVVLVSFDGDSIGAIGRMRRGGKAANYKWHVRLDELVVIDEPLPLEELATAATTAIANAVNAARQPLGGQLSDAVADEVLGLLSQLRPELEQDIEHLRDVSRPERRRPAPADGEPIVDYERDAVGLALELGGLSRERKALLSAWDGRSDEPFLSGVGQFQVLEDRALEHDARVFGDWAAIRTGLVGVTRFEDQGKRMTVINVNRAGIERAIGVDLIYYSQTYDAYVVVQYKRREASTSEERWVFRPDQQFDAELARMRELAAVEAEVSTPVEYRLDPSCCFLKLCSPTTPDAFTTDLANGVYLPLAYWDALEGSGMLVGPRGGRVLSSATVGRYFSNSLFIDLVKAGWIGSRAMTSDLIGRIIRAGVTGDRDLLLAISFDRAQAAGPTTTAGDDELVF